MESQKEININNSLIVCFCFLLSVSSVHTKIAGAAWLTIVVGGTYLLLRRSRFQLEDSTAHSPGHIAANAAVSIWLFMTALALALRAVPAIYWNDGWEERHAEIRIFLGAIGSFGLGAYAISKSSRAWLVAGLCGFCLAAAVLLIFYGADGTPTNRIPWASGVAMLILATLGTAFTVDTVQKNILVICSGVAAGSVIVLGDARGAYYLAPLWVLLFTLMQINSARRASTTKPGSPRFRSGFFAIVIATVLAVFTLGSSSSLLKNPNARIQTAANELIAYLQADSGALDTSIGARLQMWKESLKVIPDAPFLGLGTKARLERIHQWGGNLNSPIIKSLGHVHNEYLQALLEHGLWGLASFLSYTAGILWAAQRLWKGHLKTTAQTLVAIAVMHSLAEMTNVNFAHNYYPTLLSLSVAIVLLSARLEAQGSWPPAKTI